MPPDKKKRRSRWADTPNENIDREPMVPINLPPIVPVVGPVGMVVPTALGTVNNIVPVPTIPTLPPLPTAAPVINVPGKRDLYYFSSVLCCLKVPDEREGSNPV